MTCGSTDAADFSVSVVGDSDLTSDSVDAVDLSVSVVGDSSLMESDSVVALFTTGNGSHPSGLFSVISFVFSFTQYTSPSSLVFWIHGVDSDFIGDSPSTGGTKIPVSLSSNNAPVLLSVFIRSSSACSIDLSISDENLAINGSDIFFSFVNFC